MPEKFSSGLPNVLELFIPGNPPSRLRLGTIWQRAWASTWRRHINDEETAETFRDLHLEKSKQMIKLLFYGTLLRRALQ